MKRRKRPAKPTVSDRARGNRGSVIPAVLVLGAVTAGSLLLSAKIHEERSRAMLYQRAVQTRNHLARVLEMYVADSWAAQNSAMYASKYSKDHHYLDPDVQACVFGDNQIECAHGKKLHLRLLSPASNPEKDVLNIVAGPASESGDPRFWDPVRYDLQGNPCRPKAKASLQCPFEAVFSITPYCPQVKGKSEAASCRPAERTRLEYTLRVADGVQIPGGAPLSSRSGSHVHYLGCATPRARACPPYAYMIGLYKNGAPLCRWKGEKLAFQRLLTPEERVTALDVERRLLRRGAQRASGFPEKESPPATAKPPASN